MVVTAPTVEKPASAEELARRLHEAAASKLAVAPVGGGKARGMGGVIERCDVLLHTTRLDRMIEHSQADMVVSVEAGITLEALQAELAKTGQFLPLDPFHSPGHTIGGLLATGWTGPLRLRYGSPRDFLIGIRVALPDGTLASGGGRVVKNVSGYDMMKLHYAALGSLGVIVAASFKVFPKPLHDVTVSSHGGWTDIDRALGAPVAPAALELFSDGGVLARYSGSPDAVDRVVTELGWRRVGGAAPNAGRGSRWRAPSCRRSWRRCRPARSGGRRPGPVSRTGRTRTMRARSAWCAPLSRRGAGRWSCLRRRTTSYARSAPGARRRRRSRSSGG